MYTMPEYLKLACFCLSLLFLWSGSCIQTWATAVRQPLHRIHLAGSGWLRHSCVEKNRLEAEQRNLVFQVIRSTCTRCCSMPFALVGCWPFISVGLITVALATMHSWFVGLASRLATPTHVRSIAHGLIGQTLMPAQQPVGEARFLDVIWATPFASKECHQQDQAQEKHFFQQAKPATTVHKEVTVKQTELTAYTSLNNF